MADDNQRPGFTGEDVRAVQDLGIMDKFRMVKQGLDPQNSDHIKKFKSGQQMANMNQGGMVMAGVNHPGDPHIITEQDMNDSKAHPNRPSTYYNKGYADGGQVKTPAEIAQESMRKAFHFNQGGMVPNMMPPQTPQPPMPPQNVGPQMQQQTQPMQQMDQQQQMQMDALKKLRGF